MKTVKDIQDLIAANAASDNEKLAAHAKTLLGPRTHGSTTKLGINEFDPDRPLVQASSPVVRAGCELYQFHGCSGDCTLGAIPLELAMRHELKITVEDGVHGKELVVSGKQAENVVGSHPVWIISVIVGEFEGERAVFTWHPGQPLGALEDGLSPSTAVKLRREDETESIQPTAEGMRRYWPDGCYSANDTPGTPCTCVERCPAPCKGQCGCEACSEAYGDFLSSE